MRTRATETVIKCDACQQEITRPIGMYPAATNWASIEDIDICMACSTTILENLYSSRKFTKEELQDAFKHYAISARANGHILC